MSLAPFAPFRCQQGCLKSRYSRRNPGRALGFRCDTCAKPTGKWGGENLQLPKLTMIMFLLAKSKFREFFITKENSRVFHMIFFFGSGFFCWHFTCLFVFTSIVWGFLSGNFLSVVFQHKSFLIWVLRHQHGHTTSSPEVQVDSLEK